MLDETVRKAANVTDDAITDMISDNLVEERLYDPGSFVHCKIIKVPLRGINGLEMMVISLITFSHLHKATQY